MTATFTNQIKNSSSFYNETKSLKMETESFTTEGSTATIGNNDTTQVRLAQPFQLEASGNVSSVELNVSSGVSDPTADITVRIETDSSGSPSGTLVSAGATSVIPDFNSQTVSYRSATFSGLSLSANTTYWIVASIPNEPSIDTYYFWTGSSGFDDPYEHGTSKYSNDGGAWGSLGNISLDFKVNYGTSLTFTNQTKN